VGFSLIFFDPIFDPSNPPSQDEREQLQKAFEFISEGVRRIMGGEVPEEDYTDYIARGKFQH
jgi:hypothetical protein